MNTETQEAEIQVPNHHKKKALCLRLNTEVKAS